MTREIDILLGAENMGFTIVDKESHRLWLSEELTEAREADEYLEQDCLAPPPERADVSGPYPGCMQQAAATADFSRYSLVGQTRHCLIFSPPPHATPARALPAVAG